MVDNEKLFLEELTALSKKHRVSIWGCGCCGSPGFSKLDDEDMGGNYEMGGGYLEWMNPSEDAE